MIPFPTPFLGRNLIYRGPINYVAMAKSYDQNTGLIITNLHFRVSEDGREWHKALLAGDLLLHRKSGASEPGAFFPEGHVWFLSKWFVFGRLWDDDFNSRAAVFVTSDGQHFDRIVTPVDGDKGSSGDRSFVDAAVTSDGKLVLLCNSGELAISTNATSFSGRANVGFSGVNSARSIAAGTGVIVVGGTGGQGFSATDPSGTWTSRNLQFGTSTISRIRAGNVLVAVGSGKISTSALTSGTTWTAQTDPVGGAFDYLEFVSDRWFAGGVSGKWITSTLGTSAWSTPAEKPYVTEERVQGSVWDGSELLISLSNGKGSASANLVDWDRGVFTGLADANYAAMTKLP